MKKTKKLWILLTFPLLLGMASCKSGDGNNPVVPTDDIEAQLQRMTLREKVGQLFFVRPECLDTTIHFNRSGGIDFGRQER